MAAYIQNTPSPSASDAQLLYAFQKDGDLLSLHALVHRYAFLARSTAFRMRMNPDEMDLMSELFLMMHDKLSRSSKPIKSFPCWFRTVVRNYLLDILRRQACNDRFLGTRANLPSFYIEELERRMDKEKLVDAAFRVVNEGEAACLRLRYFKGMSYQEVADELGLTFKQVCGRLGRGLEKMRLYMGQVA